MKTLGLIVQIGFVVVASLLAAGCSAEDKLVGEWQSTAPSPVRLSITKGASSNDGFRAGFSHTLEGQATYSRLWLIKNESRGKILYLSAGAGAGGWMQQTSPGMALMSALPYRIVELSSNKLKIEWDNAGATPREVYEFQRVR